jgi:hypothetical protein
MLPLPLLLVNLGCAMLLGGESAAEPPPMVGAPLALRGPTEGCRATYVFTAAPHDAAAERETFYQYPATLDGVEFGSCTLMGPTLDYEWLWVVMVFEPGFRGQVSCWSGSQRSAILEVVDQDGPVPDGFVAKYHLMDPAQAAQRIIPSSSPPCPDLESVLGKVRKPLDADQLELMERGD